MAIEDLKSHFPQLDLACSKITSPTTHLYNCIAYAAGDQSRVWWPDPNGVAYWPPGAPRAENLIAFQIAYEKCGYELCDQPIDPKIFDGVAVFHKNNTPTHAAKLLANGYWSSKLGKSFDIQHNLSGVEGSQYGMVAFFMRRLRA